MGLFGQKWATHLLAGIFTRFLLAYWCIASVYHCGNNMRVLLLTSQSITKPIPPKTRSWANLCRFSRFQLSITPKVFDQIQKFFHNCSEKPNRFFLKKGVTGTLNWTFQSFLKSSEKNPKDLAATFFGFHTKTAVIQEFRRQYLYPFRVGEQCMGESLIN